MPEERTNSNDSEDVRIERLRVEHLHKAYIDGQLGLRKYIEELDKLPAQKKTRVPLSEVDSVDYRSRVSEM